MTTPLFIDNIAFAKKQERLAGTIRVAECERLAALLPSNAHVNTKISYNLKGTTNSVTQHFLHLEIKARLMTTCQRCLNEMALDIPLKFVYILSEIGDVEVDESEDFDALKISQTMDLIALIEDEIITALPIAPMHEISDKNIACVLKVASSGEKQNPFDVLIKLLKP